MERTVICECRFDSFLALICSECLSSSALTVAYQHFSRLWQTKIWKIQILCRHPSSLKCFFKTAKGKLIIGLSRISGLRLIGSVEQRSLIWNLSLCKWYEMCIFPFICSKTCWPAKGLYHSMHYLVLLFLAFLYQLCISNVVCEYRVDLSST